jgi:hypothetical protein
VTVEGLTEENWKLKESVKRLSGQLQAQAQVNQDLKKLVIASIGDDLQYRSLTQNMEKIDRFWIVYAKPCPAPTTLRPAGGHPFPVQG